MAKITNNDITMYNHIVDGFTLSYLDEKNRYYKQRYIGYTVREAVKLFKSFVKKEAVNELF